MLKYNIYIIYKLKVEFIFYSFGSYCLDLFVSSDFLKIKLINMYGQI